MGWDGGSEGVEGESFLYFSPVIDELQVGKGVVRAKSIKGWFKDRSCLVRGSVIGNAKGEEMSCARFVGIGVLWCGWRQRAWDCGEREMGTKWSTLEERISRRRWARMGTGHWADAGLRKLSSRVERVEWVIWSSDMDFVSACGLVVEGFRDGEAKRRGLEGVLLKCTRLVETGCCLQIWKGGVGCSGFGGVMLEDQSRVKFDCQGRVYNAAIVCLFFSRLGSWRAVALRSTSLLNNDSVWRFMHVMGYRTHIVKTFTTPKVVDGGAKFRFTRSRKDCGFSQRFSLRLFRSFMNISDFEFMSLSMQGGSL